MAKGRLHGLPAGVRLEIGIPQPEDRAPGRDGGRYRHAVVAEPDSVGASNHFKRRAGAFGNLAATIRSDIFSEKFVALWIESVTIERLSFNIPSWLYVKFMSADTGQYETSSCI